MTRQEQIKKLAELRKKMLHTLNGCQDAYCMINGNAIGMHTNGGCRCLKYLPDLALDLACAAEPLKNTLFWPSLKEIDSCNNEHRKGKR